MSERYLNPNEHIDHLERSVRKHKADKVKLQAELDKALKALRNLHDVQNGPPLLRHEKTWQAAYDEAGNVLEEMEQ